MNTAHVTDNSSTQIEHNAFNGSKKIIFIFTLLYIFFEITFNIGLVDFINSKNTEVSTFENLETLGRILSSLGLSLFIVNLFRFKSKVFNFIGYFTLAVLLFFTQTFVFNKILDNLSNETKLEAYALGVYRNIYINRGSDALDDGFPNIFSDTDSLYNEVVNSMVGIILYNKSLKGQVDQYVNDFFDIRLNVKSSDLGRAYDELSKIDNNDKVNELWKKYVIESKRYNNYTGLFKDKYRQKFIENIGIEPNVSKDEFVSYLKRNSYELNQIDKVVLIPENKSVGLKALYLKDIPAGLNKQEWINYIQSYITKSVETVSYKAENIDNLPHSRAVISSVVIVPIAITLSLFSIILNILVLLSSANKKFAIVTAIALFMVFLYGGVFASNSYKVPFYVNSVINMEKYHIAMMSSYRNIIHRMFINDVDPNYEEVIVIKRPTFDEFNKKFEELDMMAEKFKENNGSVNNDKQPDVRIDDSKLNDRGYYGEINKSNPYISN